MWHLISPEDLRKRAEDLRKLRRILPPKEQPKRLTMPRRYRYSVRTDRSSIGLRAFWSMHVEAMNWSRMGYSQYAAALGLSPHALRFARR